MLRQRDGCSSRLLIAVPQSEGEVAWALGRAVNNALTRALVGAGWLLLAAGVTVGQPQQDGCNRTAGVRLPQQDCHRRTAGVGRPQQDGHSRTATAGLPWQEQQNK